MLRHKGPNCSSQCSSVAKVQDQLLQISTMACAVEHSQCSIPPFFSFQLKKSIYGQLSVVYHLQNSFLYTGAAVRSEVSEKAHKNLLAVKDEYRLTESTSDGEVVC